MMIHIWACHRGYVSLHKQDGHEIGNTDEAYGLCDRFEEEEWDPFDGVIRVQYRSSPYTKATVVDSSPVAAVATPRGADTVWL